MGEARGLVPRDAGEPLVAQTARFGRIHRSTIINVEHIRDLTPLPNREFVVALRDGTRLRSSRSYEQRMRRVLATLM